MFYAPEGPTQCGALVEIGSALASGRTVFVVSDYKWSIAAHPKCRVFDSLGAAIATIMAIQQGERERLRAVS